MELLNAETELKEPLKQEQKEQNINTSALISKANHLYHLCRYKEAFELYKKVESYTLTHGHVNYRLGVMYYDGHHVEQDKNLANEYFQKALEQLHISANEGDAESQCDLGYMYYCGRGTTSDYAKAFQYYQLAAVQGHCRAQNNLGHMYRDGHGTERDRAMACKLYQLSGDNGYDRAQSSLAWMYLNGYGVNKDRKHAVLLYQLADYQGYDRARQSLTGIFNDLDESEREEYAALGPKYLSERWPSLQTHLLLKLECQNAILELFCIFTDASLGLSLPVDWIVEIVKVLIIAWPQESYSTVNK